jgi:hypothetical protein
LPTYHGGNDRGKAGDERAARVVFNGGGDGVRQCSGSKGFSGSGGVGGDPPPSDESVWESPVQRLDDSVAARQWRLGFGPNLHVTGHYL